jgi:hypothetical protein
MSSDKPRCARCGKPTHPDELIGRVCAYCVEEMRVPSRQEVSIEASATPLDPSSHILTMGVTTMRRITAFALALLFTAAPIAWAGSPHFVFVNILVSDNTISVSGKEAGLGDEEQINVVITADAACINPGTNHPKAANKESVSAAGIFPVQNGKALFSLVATAMFQPDCSPPMTVSFTNITVCDLTNGICF